MATNTQANTKKMVQLAALAAIIVVLQMLSYSVKLGPINLTLVLIPVVLGAVMYGPKEGALLGCIFGIVTLVATISGVDAGANVLWNANPFLTAVVCLLKGGAAGLCAGLVYRALRRVNDFAATLAAAMVCPIVNTGIFCIFMLTAFRSTLTEWAAGENILTYMLLVLVGVNFIVEFGVNVLIGPAIRTIVKAARS